MKSLIEHVNSGRTLVADGAVGTMLYERGLKIAECPELMNLEHPDLIEGIARLYVEAGAEIVQTNTFGASPLRLAAFGLDSRTEEINASAIRAAKRAADGRAFICASVGPCGKRLKPNGEVEPEQAYRSFERQIRVISDEGVDLICVETMTDLAEAALAVRVAKTIAPGIPVAVTLVFESTPRGIQSLGCLPISEAIRGLADTGAEIIGSNCGTGIELMVRVATEFRELTSLPLLFRPSAGIPIRRGERLVYPDNPEIFARYLPELLACKPSIVGGCCGTTPEHVAGIVRALRQSE